MSGCDCKSGFFSLRDCDGAPVGSCSDCGRTVCARHLSMTGGFSRCLDCEARASQQPVDADGRPTAAVGDDAALDDRWTYGYRHRYYSSGYHPIYAGSRDHRYYDDYDVRSFDEQETGEAEADGKAPGFGDS